MVNGSPVVLVVMGGADDDEETFNDGLWILNIDDILWTKVHKHYVIMPVLKHHIHILIFGNCIL